MEERIQLFGCDNVLFFWTCRSVLQDTAVQSDYGGEATWGTLHHQPVQMDELQVKPEAKERL